MGLRRNPIYHRMGVREVINGRSFSTKVGGCIMDPQVIRAMQEASRSFVRIEDLEEAASRTISQITGAEAGYVTSGAAAGLTLSMAACLTGLDPEKMNRLPDTAGMKNEVIIQRGHRNDYDHALRAAGARVKEIGYNYATFAYELERAIDEKTAAVFYLAGITDGSLPIARVTEIAGEKGVPVIVDASAELPPRENLRRFIGHGADLVVFSGGKHIRGPQSSGFICGRKELILAAALQHQDMDVFPETWSSRNLIDEGILPGPPHHGIGRGFKVGKEEIVGLVTALTRYVERDLEAELQHWKETTHSLVEGVNQIDGLSGAFQFPKPGGRTVPAAHIRVDPMKYGLDAHGLINALQDGDPIIAVYESFAAKGKVIIFPENLRPGDVPLILDRLREIKA